MPHSHVPLHYNVIDVIYYNTSMQYMIYVCIYLIGLSGIRNGAAWQPVVDAAAVRI